jgi:hypothetical protein
MGRFLGSVFHALAQLLAGVFSVLFVVTAVLVMLLISVDRALLNADTYKRALAENGIYERMPALAAEQLGAMEVFLSNPCADNPLICRIDGASPELQSCLTEALGEEALVDIGSFKREPTEAELQLAQPCLDQHAGTAEEPEDSGGSGGGAQMGFLNNLAPEDWEELISTLLPPDELQAMVEQALDQAFGFFDGNVDSASIPLVALRERLVGPSGQEVIELLLAAQPPCTDDQLAQLTLEVAEGEGDLVLCQPQAEDADALMFHMQERFDSLVAEMPDEAEILKPPSSPGTPGGGGAPGENASAAQSNPGGPLGDDPLAAIRLIRRWLWLSLLLPLGLLLLVTIFGVRSRKGWLRWWGAPAFIAGLLTVGLGIAAVPALDRAWLGYVAGNLPPMLSASLSGVAHALADSVVRELTQWTVLCGGVVMLLGLAGIVGSFVLEARARAAAPETGADHGN